MTYNINVRHVLSAVFVHVSLHSQAMRKPIIKT